MVDTQNKINPCPEIKANRYTEKEFCTPEDFKLHTMACDQIDAGQNLDFYMRKSNVGWAMLPNGGRKQFFMK